METVFNAKVNSYFSGYQQDHFSKLMDAVPALIAYVDQDLRYRYVNNAYQKWVGVEGDQIVGKSVLEIFGPGEFEEIKPHISHALSGEITRFECTVNHHGEIRYVDVCYTPDIDSDRNVRGLTVHVNDITDKKRTERDFRDCVENAAINLHWVNSEGIIIWANRSELEMLGYTAEEYIGRHISEFHADQSVISDILIRLSSNETLDKYEAVLKRRDGSLRHVLISSNVLWQDGKFIHTRCFTLDVTEKKRTEEKLTETREQYRQLIQVLPMPVYTCDHDGFITMFNEAATELFGRAPQVGVDRWSGSWKVLNKDGTDLRIEDVPMAIALREGRAVNSQEFIIVRPDGSRRHVLPHPKPIFDQEGRLTGAVNVLVDITDQRLMEVALRESETMYSQVVSGLGVAIYTCDANGRVLLYNKAAAALWGREPQVGKDMWCGSWKIFRPDGSPLPLDSCPMAVALKEGRAVLDEEIIIERQDGTRTHVSPHPHPLFDDNGKVIGAVNLLIDITEQRRTMEALVESEERFRILANEAPIVIWTTDAYGNFNYVNHQWTELTGTPEAEAMGSRWLDFIHPDDKEEASRQWFIAMADESKYESKFRYRHKQHDHVFVKASGTPRYSATGELIGYIGIMLDVSLQENSKSALEKEIKARTYDLLIKNEELRKSEERYHRMIDEVQDYAIILLDKDGFIQNWNAGAEKIKGYKAREVIGKNFRIFYTPEDRQRLLPDQLIQIARESGRALHEGWRIRKDGTLFWGSIVLTALHDDQKEVIGFSKVTRDLTPRKAAEDALRANALDLEEKNRKLEEMNQELGAFAYISSHDLQEPLRKIQTFSSRIQELEQEKFSDKSKDYFDRIQNVAQRMRTLIEDLLAYSRANTSERKFVATDLTQILEEVKAEHKETVEEKNATVVSDTLPVVDVIPFQFHQLMANLLSNALKFTRPGVAPEISIRSEVVDGDQIDSPVAVKDRKYCHISVADNGIGFEPSYNSKIFEIFQRLHNRKDYDGTGVGLAICKKIVENHSGVIQAEGEVDKGATFHIYLPL